MPLVDWEKLHPSTLLRLPRYDSLAYHMVGDQEPIGFEIPRLLRSPLLHMLPFLPKSGLQFISPLEYQKECIRKNMHQVVRFGVVFSQNFSTWADEVLSEPSFLHVFLWHTTNPSAIDRLMRMTQSKLILVPNEKIAKSLLKAGIKEADMPPDIPSIYKLIEERVRENAKVTSAEFSERLKKIAQLAEKYHKDYFPRQALPFSPLKINLAQLGHLFGQFGENLWDELPNDRSKRAEALAASFRGVADALFFVRSFPDNESRDLRPPPAAILAFPSINPMVHIHWKRAAKRLPKKMRRLAKAIISARVAEQDSTDYLNRTEIGSQQEAKLVARLGTPELAAYSHFFDTVGYLHSSFGASPYLRGPIKGGSLAEQHQFFSPDQYSRNPSSLEICKRVHEFGATLADALHPSVRAAIHAYPGGVVAISDLPLEWMDLNGVPLCFARNLCRMPEGAATNLLSQFGRNRTSTYRITADTLRRTLVVCGANAGDPIAKAFDVLQAFHLEQQEPRPHMVRCTSLAEFYALVNEFRPELLIIDSHGRFVHNDSGTEIAFGDEHLDGIKVIKHLPQVPLVFLSSCWGAPLYGCPNTIAHAFFETGSFAVTTPVLPVDVKRGGVLYTRILRNLAAASAEPLHPNWSSFMSHTVRTSYLSDLDALVRHRLGVEPEKDSWVKKRGKWFHSTMSFSTREKAYHEAHDIVASCYDEGLAPAVREILDKREYLPEFMFYSTMGRADLVEFQVWNQKFHSPTNDTITVREADAKMISAQ